jgi:hypothetical protein
MIQLGEKFFYNILIDVFISMEMGIRLSTAFLDGRNGNGYAENLQT